MNNSLRAERCCTRAPYAIGWSSFAIDPSKKMLWREAAHLIFQVVKGEFVYPACNGNVCSDLTPHRIGSTNPSEWYSSVPSPPSLTHPFFEPCYLFGPAASYLWNIIPTYYNLTSWLLCWKTANHRRGPPHHHPWISSQPKHCRVLCNIRMWVRSVGTRLQSVLTKVEIRLPEWYNADK